MLMRTFLNNIVRELIPVAVHGYFFYYLLTWSFIKSGTCRCTYRSRHRMSYRHVRFIIYSTLVCIEID